MQQKVQETNLWSLAAPIRRSLMRRPLLKLGAALSFPYIHEAIILSLSPFTRQLEKSNFDSREVISCSVLREAFGQKWQASPLCPQGRPSANKPDENRGFLISFQKDRAYYTEEPFSSHQFMIIAFVMYFLGFHVIQICCLRTRKCIRHWINGEDLHRNGCAA